MQHVASQYARHGKVLILLYTKGGRIKGCSLVRPDQNVNSNRSQDGAGATCTTNEQAFLRTWPSPDACLLCCSRRHKPQAQACTWRGAAYALRIL